MALTWGAWHDAGNNGMRVGIDTYGGTGVDTNSTTFSFKYDLWTGNKYNYDGDTQTLTLSGNVGGTVNYTNNEGTGTSTKRSGGRTASYTYPADSYGSSPGAFWIGAKVSGAYNGSTPSCTVAVDIPARPYAPSNPPSNIVAVRNSDTQVTVSGTHPAPTPQRPNMTMSIQMRTYSGASWGLWESIYTGIGTSYVKTGLQSNRIYQFRMRLDNSSGSSVWVDSNEVSMTPSKPVSVSAAMLPSSGGVKVDWTIDHYNAAEIVYKIERQVNGEPWQPVGSTPFGLQTFTDTTPGAGLNQYRVAVTRGSLVSAWTMSGTVQTVVAPAAPTSLSPSNTTIDLAAGATLTWTHQHGGDGKPQTRYMIHYSTDNGATWTQLADNSSAASSYVLAPGALPNGKVYLWQVRTQGEASAGWGPYSISARFTAAARPTVNLLVPGPVTNIEKVFVAWTYSKQDGKPQSQWTATLSSSNGSVLETLQNSGEGNFAAFNLSVVSGSSYKVEVQVVSSDGLVSDTVSRQTVVDFGVLGTPAVSLLLPGPTTVATEVETSWTYTANGNGAQIAWFATLTDADGALVESLLGLGQVYTAVFSTVVVDRRLYVVGVRALSSAGLWSPVAEQQTKVKHPTLVDQGYGRWVVWDGEDWRSVDLNFLVGYDGEGMFTYRYMPDVRARYGGLWPPGAKEVSR